MLKQRIITALILLAVLLPALFWSTPQPFIALSLILLAAAGWEWGRLNGLSQFPSVLLALVLVVACLFGWARGWVQAPSAVVWSLTGAIWVLAGAWLIRAGVPAWPHVPKVLRVIGGIAALALAWLAVAQARVIGINFLLSVLVLVWVADVFAYFAGRKFGLKYSKRKLAPDISPGKSWEGVWGGVAGVLVLALAWVIADRASGAAVPSLYTRLAAWGWPVLVIAVVFLAAMSVVGDLVESLVKRSAGAKDSSQLLPGHGGVLDRVDALLPTLPLAMMLASLCVLPR